jgi:hypothetical protein
MAFTQSDLDKLEQAIASGAMRVKYTDKEVEYQSTEDMFKAREMIKKELGLTKNRRSRTYFSTSKGLR